jgi:hypothetical protein
MDAAIALVEPQMEGIFHAPFNAALLHAVRLAYPEAAVSFRAFSGHARVVRGILDEHAPGLAERVEWRTLPFAAGGPLIARWRRSGPTIRTLLDRRERLLFCSISRMQLLHLKRAMRQGDQVRAVLHGDLDQIERPPRASLPMRPFTLERVLLRPHPAGLRYLLLGESIRAHLPERFSVLRANAQVIDHPYHFLPLRATAARTPVFGIFGNCGDGRLLEEVARAVKAADPAILIRLVGFLSDREAVERLRPLVEDVGDLPIPRESFLRRAEEITHALWLAPTGSFRLRASGTFFDALAHGTPLIYTANPYIDQYLSGTWTAGVRCASIEDIVRAVLEVVGTYTPVAYFAQRETLADLRARFSPTALARSLPATLGWEG